MLSSARPLGGDRESGTVQLLVSCTTDLHGNVRRAPRMLLLPPARSLPGFTGRLPLESDSQA